MSKNSFGFKVDGIKHEGYIAEKLNITGDTTIEKIGELINGVIEKLLEV